MDRGQVTTFRSQFSVSTIQILQIKIICQAWQFSHLLGPKYCYFLPNGLEKTENAQYSINSG